MHVSKRNNALLTEGPNVARYQVCSLSEGGLHQVKLLFRMHHKKINQCTKDQLTS